MNPVIAGGGLRTLDWRPGQLARLIALLAGGLLWIAGLAAAPESGKGSIVGTVSNRGTGNLLEGARVELPALGVAVFTDGTGRFVLEGVQGRF